jgi:hypothetical protein
VLAKADWQSGLRPLRFLAKHAFVRPTSGMVSLHSLRASWVQASRTVSAAAGREDPDVAKIRTPGAMMAMKRTERARTFFIFRDPHVMLIPLPLPADRKGKK